MRENPFPAFMESPGLRPASEERSLVERRERERFAASLRSVFETDPLEDGVTHPAEEIIGGALRSTDGRRVLGWLESFSRDAAQPDFAASVLRCLGRQERPGEPPWRAEVVETALDSDDVRIRDAAVQAAESWGGPDMRDILRAHSESARWLRDHIRDVVVDLGE